jgi:Enoyl-CoA hydratase/isomerase
MAGVTLARTGDLLEITICRSERRNALGEEEWERLDAAVAEAEGDPTCQFVLMQGSGDFFCSGADLDLERAARLDALLALIETNTAILRRFERLPQIVLAALNGPAIGIGVHIALCADIIFAVDAAYFWIPEARLGIADVLHFWNVGAAARSFGGVLNDAPWSETLGGRCPQPRPDRRGVRGPRAVARIGRRMFDEFARVEHGRADGRQAPCQLSCGAVPSCRAACRERVRARSGEDQMKHRRWRSGIPKPIRFAAAVVGN